MRMLLVVLCLLGWGILFFVGRDDLQRRNDLTVATTRLADTGKAQIANRAVDTGSASRLQAACARGASSGVTAGLAIARIAAPAHPSSAGVRPVIGAAQIREAIAP